MSIENEQKTPAAPAGKADQNERVVMRISTPGRYEVKTFTGKVWAVKIIEQDEVLGVFLEMTKSFIPISEFVDVEVLRKYSDDEVKSSHC